MIDPKEARQKKYSKQAKGPRGMTGHEKAKAKQKAEQAKQVECTDYVYARHKKSFQTLQKIPLRTWQKFSQATRREYAVEYSNNDDSFFRLSSHPATGTPRRTKVHRSL